MHSTQLLQLLKILNKQELRKFRSYLQSNYHNEHHEVFQLFLVLRKYAPRYQSVRLKRASVYQQLYGSQEYNNKKLNKLAHQLKKCLQRFLVSYDIDQNSDLQNRLLLQALARRHHPTYAKQSKKAIASIMQKATHEKDIFDYLYGFQLSYNLWSNINTQKIGKHSLLLKSANENLDKFYWLNKLKIILEHKISSNIIRNRFVIPQVDESLQLVITFPHLKREVLVDLLLQAIKMTVSNKVSDFFSLKAAFFGSFDQLSKKEARDILLVLTNFYISRLGKEDTFFAKEGFELSKFADEQGLLLENNRIRDPMLH